MPQKKHTDNPRIVFPLSLLLVATIFIADLRIPGGAAVGLFYALALFLIMRLRTNWPLITVTFLSLTCVWLDFLWGVPGPSVEQTLLNRALTTLSICIVAALLHLRRVAAEREEKKRTRSAGIFRAALEAAPEAMLVVDHGKRVHWANSAAIAMFSPAIIGQEFTQLFTEIHRVEFVHQLDQALAGPGARVTEDGRTVHVLAQTKEVPVEYRISSFTSDETMAIVSLSDQRQRQQYEERIRAVQRMESVGKLTGGIAHDFNNILMVIMGYLDLVRAELPAKSTAHENLNEVLKAANRATELVKQLLSFSRRQIISPRRVNPTTIMRDLMNMLARMLGEDIEIQTFLPDDTWTINIDTSQFEQVLINLTINARDAMPKGGKLLIEAQNIHLSHEYCREHPDVVPGEHVMIAVTDTGIGMTDAVRVRIFDPFFTTKDVGKGTGLGLATAYGIVKQARGHIWVYSEPGQGSTFKLYFPRVHGAAEAQQEKAARTMPRGGNELVLDVEDEETIRRLIVSLLRGAGYTVLEASNGRDALLKTEAIKHIDLLVTDVIMPQMGGKDLALRLSDRCGALKVLYISGYTENAIVNNGVLYDDLAFLQKPFSPEDLLRRVREIIDT